MEQGSIAFTGWFFDARYDLTAAFPVYRIHVCLSSEHAFLGRVEGGLLILHRQDTVVIKISFRRMSFSYFTWRNSHARSRSRSSSDLYHEVINSLSG